MYSYEKVTVTNVIPEQLKKLEEIAQNVWWSWNPEARILYKLIDKDLWVNVEKNPVRFMQQVSLRKLEEAYNSPEYMDKYNKIAGLFDTYMNEKNTWFVKNYPDKQDQVIAYFSTEFGLTEVLPIYSGGLGILSGDHCKSASDLGLPFVGIGLFYHQGYFSQRINSKGEQETYYPELNYCNLPINPVLDEYGNEIFINVDFPGRTVYARILEVKVGRIPIYLLDTNIKNNTEEDRYITARLYGGDKETRIQQEILLGIGGVKLLEALKINAVAYHMNEGHSAFMGLELIRKLILEKGLTFNEAKEVVISSSVFTTHTPVPAGNEVFPIQLIDKYFSNYWGLLGINRHEFIDLGLKIGDTNQEFNMTVLAFNLSGRRNGVSMLHGAVSRHIYNNVWEDIPEDEIPIGHITNGVNSQTWIAHELRTLFDKYVGIGWEGKLLEKDMWDNVDQIPDQELWEAHKRVKAVSINTIRKRLKEQHIANGDSLEQIKQIDNILNPDVLTIGFARRFATYKRADLIFRDIIRIAKIINNNLMPVQIIFAGKAHPADIPGHDIIKHITEISKEEEFYGKVVIIENYNMSIARALVQGCDVWLNNPRRPLEASGTSGQKAGLNGVINFSVLDGWWVEGFNGKDGWEIGSDTSYDSENQQDDADSESIYLTMEKELVPLFYDCNESGIPVGWVKVMKESIKSVGYNYNTSRMVKDYLEKMYLPSIERMNEIQQSNFEIIRRLAEWKANVEKNWGFVQIMPDKNDAQNQSIILTNQGINVSTLIEIRGISTSDIKVECYYGKVLDGGILGNAKTSELVLKEQTGEYIYRYEGQIEFNDGGDYGYTFRVIPTNVHLIDKHSTGLIKWVIK